MAYLGRSERQALGPLIPAAVYAFLEPDYAQTAHHLRDIGLTSEQIDQVVAESWPKHRIQSDVAAAASQLTRYLAEVGALENMRTLAAFEESELLGPGYEERGDASRELTG